MEGAFGATRTSGGVEVLRLQSAARNSLEWFEQCERYLDLHPVQFNYSLLTRVATHLPREPAAARSSMAALGGGLVPGAGGRARRAERRCSRRSACRDMELINRVVVSPMAQYKAVDGCPTDWHFVHYAERAKGGAGLVYTEMTCVSRRGPHHTRMHRLVRARARSGVAAAHRVRARRDGGQDLLPDRPLRSQGQHAAGLGGDRPATGRGQLAGDVRLGHPVVASAARCRGR